MKLTTTRDALSDAVTWTARTIPNRPPVPILSGIRLTAEAEMITLEAFDYETSAKTTSPADVDTPGTVVVSGRLLADIVKALPAKPVTLTVEGTTLHVKCGAAKFKLLTMPADDYPALPATPGPLGTIDNETFEYAVGQVAIAASRDESLALLTTVRVETEPGRMSLLATDRYRLAVRELEWDGTETGAFLVRAKSLTEAAKSLRGPVTLGADGDHVTFADTTRTLNTSLFDGEYPPVRRLFPDTTTDVEVNTAELIDAVKRASLVAERNTPVRLVFTAGAVTVEAGSQDDASASEEIPATLTGDDLTAAFNPQYLLDGLHALDAPAVVFGFTHPHKPAVLTGRTSAGEDIAGYRYLLVPIRVAN